MMESESKDHSIDEVAKIKQVERTIPLSPVKRIRKGTGDKNLDGQNTVGQNVELHAEESELNSPDVWYKGVIKQYNTERNTYLVEFEDGGSDYYSLQELDIKLVEKKNMSEQLIEQTHDSKPSPSAEKTLGDGDRRSSSSGNKQGDVQINQVTTSSPNKTQADKPSHVDIAAEEVNDSKATRVKPSNEEEKEEKLAPTQDNDELMQLHSARRNSISQSLVVDTTVSELRQLQKMSSTQAHTGGQENKASKSDVKHDTRKKQPTQLMIKAKLFQPMLKKLLLERLKLGPGGYEKLKSKGFPKLTEPLVLVQRGLGGNVPTTSTAAAKGTTIASAGANAALIEQMRQQFLAIQQQLNEKDEDEEDDEELLSSPTKASMTIQRSNTPAELSNQAASSRIAALRHTFGMHSHTSGHSNMAMAASAAVSQLRRNSISSAISCVPDSLKEFQREESSRRASIADPIKIASSGPVPSSAARASEPLGPPSARGEVSDILEARKASIGGLGGSGLGTDDLEIIFELPPSPTAHPREERLTDLRASLEESCGSGDRLEEAQADLAAQQISVGRVDPAELARHKQIVTDAFREQQSARRAAFTLRQEELKAREVQARNRVVQAAAAARERLARQERTLRVSMREREGLLGRLFRRQLEQMRASLLRQEAIVRENFGELRRGMTGLYGGRRSVTVNWRRQPQPVRIRVDLLRALKDKVPRGRYVVLATLYDRLGGVPLQFSRLSEGGRRREEMPPATAPVSHSGRHGAVELAVGQHVFCVCPSKAELRPSMVYVLELFLLGSEKRQTPDRVVGWTVLPACTKHLEFTRGKFRLPVMAGELDRRCDKYARMLNRVARNLDTWLCNVYLEVEPLPREFINRVDGSVKTEFEVSKECTRKLLLTDKAMNFALPPGDEVGRAGRFGRSRMVFRHRKVAPDRRRSSEDGLRHRTKPIAANRDYFKRLVSEPRESPAAAAEASGKTALDEEEYQFAVERSFNSKAPGTMERVQFVLHEIKTDFSKAALLSSEIWTTVLTVVLALWLRVYVHYLGQYLYVMNGNGAVYGFEVLAHRVVLKYSWQTMPPYKELLVVIAGPISNTLLFGVFSAMALLSTTFLGALPDTFSRWTAAFGVAALLDPLLTFVVDLLSNNIHCSQYEVCTSGGQPSECWCSEGDASKLYYRFLLDQGSGFVGVVLVGVTYAALTALNTVMLYMYMSNVYMNGRVLDLHRRLHLRDAAFFVPHDFEVSTEELDHICQRARRWRGPRGDHREIHIAEHVDTEEGAKKVPKKPITVADIRIYTVCPTPGNEGEPASKEMTLWRRFLRQTDGSILEIFGSTHAAQQPAVSVPARPPNDEVVIPIASGDPVEDASARGAPAIPEERVADVEVGVTEAA